MTTGGSAARGTASTLRRVIVGVIIASFGLAALGGIVVLLGGDLGETAGRVLSTTLAVGIFSVAVLCCVALVGRRLQVFGFVGAAVSLATAVWVVSMIWADWSWEDDTPWRLMWSGIALTAAFALASLLLLLADRTRPAVRIGLVATLALFAVVLLLTLYVIWWPDEVDSDVFPRIIGIAAILAALGAVVVPVMSLLLRDRGASSTSGDATHRLERAAAERGIPTEVLLDRMLDALPPVGPTAGAAADPRADGQ